MKRIVPSISLCLAIFILANAIGCGQAPEPAQSKAWHEGMAVSPLDEVDPNSGQVAQFGDRVYFAGQPSEAALTDYAQQGVATVINLRTQPEMDGLSFDEPAVTESLGMRYVHVPIGGEPPTQDQLDRLFAELESSGEGPTLLHCASSNRVGYVWSLYRAQRHGLDPDAAIAEGKRAGMKSPALEERARQALNPQPDAE